MRHGFGPGPPEIMCAAPGTHRPDHRDASPAAAPRGRRTALPLGAALVPPDPPLVDAGAGIRLRPWTTSRGDVDALTAAWADPVLAAANGVPRDTSAASAARWLAGDPARHAAGRCLDLVVAPEDPEAGNVLGEVGLRNIDRVRRRAEISWWIAVEQRGRGLATAATRLLAGWALSPAGGGLQQVWARIDPSNTASARVAATAGLACRGTADGTDVWSRTAR